MFLPSPAMYLAQFLSPLLLGALRGVLRACPTWPIGSRWCWPFSSSSAPCVSR